MNLTERRADVISRFYREVLHPQAHAEADLHAAIAKSDNIVQVGTVEQLIDRWADEQLLVPLEPRASTIHTHGYECDCEQCRNCEPVDPYVWHPNWPVLVALGGGLLFYGLLAWWAS